MNITSIVFTGGIAPKQNSPEGPYSGVGRAMPAWGDLRCIRCGFDYCGCWR